MKENRWLFLYYSDFWFLPCPNPIHPKIVQELLGHSQITLTLDTYSHVLPSMQGEALDRLGALLATAGDPVAVTVAVNAGQGAGA